MQPALRVAFAGVSVSGSGRPLRIMGSRLALAGLMMLCLTAQGRCAEQGRFHRLDTQAAVKKLVQNGSADALAAAALLKQMGADTDTGAYALKCPRRPAGARTSRAGMARRAYVRYQ